MASDPARFKPKVVVTPASVFKPNRRKISRPTPIRTDPYRIWDFLVLIGTTLVAAVVVVMDASFNFPNRE
jgi:hypothetical protein